MTNIKITQEAREAAASIAEWQASTGWRPCFFVPEFAGKAREGVWDNHPLVEMMQALINQTLDRIAHETDRRMVRYIARANEANEAGDDELAYGRRECSLAMEFFGYYIRTLKDN